MSRPAVFFDRDNTLIISDGYLGDAAQVTLVAGAADAVARLRALGFAIVVVSNQSGVARGLFGEDQVRAVNARLDELLRNANPAAAVDQHEYCPFHPQATIAIYRQESELRKPRPGMLLKASEKLGIDLTRSWLIGDAPRDIEAGRAAGCRTILFADPTLPQSPASDAPQRVAPDFSVCALDEAVRIIAQAWGGQAAERPTTPPAPEPAPEPAPGIPPVKPARLEQLAEEILREVRRRNHPDHADFSVGKLLAGICQVLVLAALFYAYLWRDAATSITNTLLLALTLQCLTIALLIMGRQR